VILGSWGWDLWCLSLVVRGLGVSSWSEAMKLLLSSALLMSFPSPKTNTSICSY